MPLTALGPGLWPRQALHGGVRLMQGNNPCHHWPGPASGRPGCLCRPGIPPWMVPRAPEHPACSSDLWFKQRAAGATGIARNDPPAIRPQDAPPQDNRMPSGTV
jgi:hypothetical protein